LLFLRLGNHWRMHNPVWAIVHQGWQRRILLASHPVKSGKVTVLVKDTPKMVIGKMIIAGNMICLGCRAAKVIIV